MAGVTFTLEMQSYDRLTQPIGRAYATLVRGLARAATDAWPFDAAKARRRFTKAK